MSDTKQYFTWEGLHEEWIGAYYQWYDVAIIIHVNDIIGGGGAAIQQQHVYLPPAELIKQKLPEREYKRFITLVCKVNEITFKQMKERREKNQPEVTLIEIQKTIQEVAKPFVSVKRINRVDI